MVVKLEFHIGERFFIFASNVLVIFLINYNLDYKAFININCVDERDDE